MSGGTKNGDGPTDGPGGGDAFLRELGEGGLSESDAMEALIGSLEAATTTDGLRARILASTETTARFAFALEEVASLVHVSVQGARDLLLGIDVSDSWVDAPFPGVGLYNFEGGPEVRGAVTGFVRMMAGSVFPHHHHEGQESILVLSGRFRDSHGKVAG
ncbi:MAG: cupin domain-containing protein, partial [Deltaproteobacteria bacterium]|nr:cupin domain-containing protein [Deltaproteobacteria bacterium]